MTTQKQPTSRTIEKAGCVVFTPGGNVLICTSLSQPDKWVLPKGHCDILKGTKDTYETHDVTAVREVEEEIGWQVALLDASPAGEVTRYLFDEKVGNDTIGVYEHVVYFVAEIVARTGEGERPILQCDVITALSQLSFHDVKEVLLKAYATREIIRYIGEAEDVEPLPEE